MSWRIRQREQTRQRCGCGGAKQGGGPDYCVCPHCGTRQPHSQGVPCRETKCPRCGTFMRREYNTVISENQP